MYKSCKTAKKEVKKVAQEIRFKANEELHSKLETKDRGKISIRLQD